MRFVPRFLAIDPLCQGLTIAVLIAVTVTHHGIKSPIPARRNGPPVLFFWGGLRKERMGADC